MKWNRTVALMLLACGGLLISGCITVNIPPGSASFTSPYHGSSWQGSSNALQPYSPGTGFYGCTDHDKAIVTVVLSPAFGGTDTSTGPFQVSITTPYENLTQILDFAQPMTSTIPMHQGDCFTVSLSSNAYFPPDHCGIVPQPGCDPSEPVVKWDGADYTISW